MNLSFLRKELAATLKLAWPIMGAQMAYLSMSFVDNLMVARLGTVPLAALALASTLYLFLLVFNIGVIMALRPLIGNAFGAQNHDEIQNVTQHGIWVTVGLSLFTMGIFRLSPWIFSALGQEKDLIPLAQIYLNAVAWGIPGALGYFCLRQFSESISKSMPSLVVGILGALLNIPVNYVLIFGKLGVPRLGVQGAGIGTSIVSWSMLIAMIIYIRLSPILRNYQISNRLFQIHWAQIKKILFLGVPLSAARISEVGFVVTVTWLAGTFGALSLAAHQISLRTAAFTFMMPLGLSMATSVRVAQAIGRKDWESASLVGWVGISLSAAIMSGPGILFLTAPKLVIAMFTSEPVLVSATIPLVRIAGIFQIFDGLQALGIGALQGLKDTRIPFVATLISYWAIGFPFGYWLAFQQGMGVTGLWFAMVLGLALAALLHAIRFYFLLQDLSSLTRHAT